MSSLYNKALQEETLFELFKSEAYTDTEKALRLATTTVSDQILKVKDGSWSKKKLNSVKKSIDTEITKAYGGLFGQLNDELSPIASSVRTNMLNDNYSKVPTGTINEITSPNRIVQGYSAKDLFKATSDNHARQMKVIVGSGVARGKPSNTIARELAAKNAALTNNQLKSATQTYITEARASVREQSYRDLESVGVIKGYEYVATLDSGTTEYCRNHDNVIYYQPINEITNKINVHFRCRSVFVPITGGTTKGKRASMSGPIEDEGYGSWFKKQAPSFQKTVLGNKRFKAYQSGDYKVGGLPDIKGSLLSFQTIDDQLKTVFKASALTIEQGLGKAINEYTEDHIALTNDAKSELNELFEVYKPSNVNDKIYRGLEMNGKNAKYLTLKVGDTFQDKYPTSWTNSGDIAEEFTRTFIPTRKNDSVYLTLNKAKDQGFELGNLSSKRREEEVLISPNHPMKVIKTDKKTLKDGTTRINITFEPIL